MTHSAGRWPRLANTSNMKVKRTPGQTDNHCPPFVYDITVTPLTCAVNASCFLSIGVDFNVSFGKVTVCFKLTMSSFHQSRIHRMVTLKVDNVSKNSTKGALKTIFEGVGPVGDIYIPRKKHTHETRGFVFIRYTYHAI